MERHSRVIATCLLFSIGQIGLSASAQAGFFEDSKASVELRNFYINRDYSQASTTQSKQEEWAQGFCCATHQGSLQALSALGWMRSVWPV